MKKPTLFLTKFSPFFFFAKFFLLVSLFFFELSQKLIGFAAKSHSSDDMQTVITAGGGFQFPAVPQKPTLQLSLSGSGMVLKNVNPLHLLPDGRINPLHFASCFDGVFGRVVDQQGAHSTLKCFMCQVGPCALENNGEGKKIFLEVINDPVTMQLKSRVTQKASIVDHLVNFHKVVPAQLIPTTSITKESKEQETKTAPEAVTRNKQRDKSLLATLAAVIPIPAAAFDVPVVRVLLNSLGLEDWSSSTIRRTQSELMETESRASADFFATYCGAHYVVDGFQISMQETITLRFLPAIGVSFDGVDRGVGFTTFCVSHWKEIIVPRPGTQPATLDKILVLESKPVGVMNVDSHKPLDTNNALVTVLKKLNIDPMCIVGACGDGAKVMRSAIMDPAIAVAGEDPPLLLNRFVVDGEHTISTVVGHATNTNFFEDHTRPIIVAAEYLSSNKAFRVITLLANQLQKLTLAQPPCDTRITGTAIYLGQCLKLFPLVAVAIKTVRPSSFSTTMWQEIFGAVTRGEAVFKTAGVIYEILRPLTMIAPGLGATSLPTLSLRWEVCVFMRRHVEAVLARVTIESEQHIKELKQWGNFTCDLLSGYLAPFCFMTPAAKAAGPRGLSHADEHLDAHSDVLSKRARKRPLQVPADALEPEMAPLVQGADPAMVEPPIAGTPGVDAQRAKRAKRVPNLATGRQAEPVPDVRVEPGVVEIEALGVAPAAPREDPKTEEFSRTVAQNPLMLAAIFLDPATTYYLHQLSPNGTVLYKPERNVAMEYIHSTLMRYVIPPARFVPDADVDASEEYPVPKVQAVVVTDKQFSDAILAAVRVEGNVYSKEVKSSNMLPSFLSTTTDPELTASAEHRRARYWVDAKKKYPLLAVAARLILLGPASSMDCERVHSVLRLLLTHTRNRLTPPNVEGLTFLYMSLRKHGKHISEKNVGRTVAIDDASDEDHTANVDSEQAELSSSDNE